MITFGLTGGIASGKSTVTKTIRAHNIPVVDADIISREIVEPGKPCLQMIIDHFGKEHLNEDGTLNRASLSAVVFPSKEGLAAIGKIMTPMITEEAHRQIKVHHDNGARLVGYDAALICEQGNADKFRPLIVVACPQHMQLERLMKRNQLTEAQAMDRINAQMSAEDKIKMADFVIKTDGTIEQSVKQTEIVIHNLWVKYYDQELKAGRMTYNQVPWPYRDTAGNDRDDI